MTFKKTNLRKGKDSFLKMKKYLTLASISVLFISFLVISLAKPRLGTMFDRFYDTSIITGSWNSNLLTYSYYLMIPLFIFSSIGLFLNIKRDRRKRDKINKSLIISIVISILWFILYRLFFIK